MSKENCSFCGYNVLQRKIPLSHSGVKVLQVVKYDEGIVCFFFPIKIEKFQTQNLFTEKFVIQSNKGTEIFSTSLYLNLQYISQGWTILFMQESPTLMFNIFPTGFCQTLMILYETEIFFETYI